MKKKLICFIAIVLSVLIPLQNLALAKGDNGDISKNKKTVLVKYKNDNQNNKISISSSDLKVKKNLRDKKVKLLEANNDTIDKLRKDKNVLYVEEDSIVKKSDDKITWNVEAVKAPELQKKNYSGKGIKVAVFDTGIDTKNDDLNVAGGISFVENSTSYNDDNGHGTAMASILSAIKNDSGYLGVAPEIDLYSVKVLDKNGEGRYSSIIEGLQWAIDNNISIIAMSFGGLQYSRILQEAINEAYFHNIIIIAAAGNNGDHENVDFPARYKNVISVGAVDQSNSIASFSNRGTQLDIVAPGVSIEVSGLDNKNEKISGTSASVPHVAGIAAQLLSAKGSITNSQMRNILLGSATSLGEKNTYGYGLINAEESLKNINTVFDLPEKAEVTDSNSNDDGTVNSSVVKYSGDNQHIKLGEDAVLGLQYSESHNDIEVTVKRGTNVLKTETISVYGEDPYDEVAYYTCSSDILNQIGTYTVRFHCPDYPNADEIFTIYVEDQGSENPPEDPPQKPANISVVPHSNYLVVSWNNVSNADNYDVEINGSINKTSVSSTCVTGTLTPNTYYTVRVRAVNTGGVSDWSTMVDTCTLASIPVQREGNFDPKTMSVSVSWQDNGNPSGTQYKLALFNEDGSIKKEENWTTDLFDTISGLNYSTTYMVKIKAKNFAGVETEWYQFGAVIVPPKTQCDSGLKEGQYGYYNTDTQVCVNEPVNIVTGNYYSSEEDINIPEIGLPLQIQRSYNSIDLRTGILGRSWRLNYESYISVDSATGNVSVTYPDGHVGRFIAKSDSSGFIAPEGVFEVLTVDGNGIYSLELKDKTVYKYNSLGKLISLTDKNNNIIIVTYDDIGQIKAITGQGGKKLNFSFESGKLKSITDPANRTISYTYDNAGNLSKVVKLGGGEKNYDYSTYGLTSITDENNKKFIENEYDKYNRIIRQFDENRNEITYAYDDINQETICHYVASNITEKYKYNDKLYVTRITYTDNTYEEYTFDQWGNKDSIRDRNGNMTTYEYDQRGNIKVITSAAPYFYKTNYTYDENDNIKQITSPAGAVTDYTYDERGNVKTITRKIDQSTTAVTVYDYDNNGRVISLTDPENNITGYEYLNSPYPAKIIKPENETINITYDSLNREKTSNDKNGTITYVYNDKDKIEKIIDQNNNITRFKYDSVGNLIKSIKPEQYNPQTDDGIGTTYRYDAMDRPIKKIDGLGAVSAVKYDEFGNIIKEINPNYYNNTLDDGLGLVYTYDSNKRLIKVTYPSGKKARIKYDAVGNKIKEIDANNYNEATDDGPGIEYSYDQLNRLTLVKDVYGNVISKFIYDADGNVIKAIDGKGYLTNNTDELRYGKVVKYNAAGWLVEQREPLKNQNGSIYYKITRYTYNKNGLILENKTSQDYVTLTGEPSSWNIITYEYNKSGKPVKISDTVGGIIEYRYNDLGQVDMEKSLINDQRSSKVFYTYNKLGKVESIKREIISDDLVGGDASGITFAVTTFAYDKNGNVINTTRPEGYKTYFEYDALGRLSSKKEEIQYSQLTEYSTSISISTDKAAILPGEQVEYKLKIKPDRVVSGFETIVEYDARFCKYIGLTQKIDGITVDSSTSGKIKITGVNSGIANETIVAALQFKMVDGVSGKGYITINSVSTYTDNTGNKHKFSEGYGSIVEAKTLDMNNDGKVETNDFTYIAKNEGSTLDNLSYEEKYDIDGNGKIDAFDLNYLKDYLFSNSQSSSQLDILEQAKFYEKFSNAVYAESLSDGIRETSYEYDKAGNIIKESYANGSIEYKYDAYNRRISVKDKAKNETRIFYDEVGNIIKEIAPQYYDSLTDNGVGTEYIYDKMNRLTEVKDAYGNVTKRNVYDINGLVTKTVDAEGYLSGSNDSSRYGVEYTYDIGNRVEAVTTPEARDKSKTSSSYAYDAAGNVTSYKDGEQNTTLYSYDMWGKTTKVIDPYGTVTSYSYDNAGNLTGLVDGNKNKTTYRYNSLNQLSEMIDALEQKVYYKHDKEGRLKQQIDRNGQTINYDYNSDNNITNMSIVGRTEQNKFLYNADGSLLAAITATNIDSFIYNTNDQLVLKNRNGKKVLEYDYDKNGNVMRVVDQTGQSTSYTYDYNNNLKTVKDGNDLLATYNYNPDQTVSSLIYKSGINISYSYDKDKNVTSLLQKSSSGDLLNSFIYSYDNNGNQLTINENGTTIEYTYDKLNRLSSAGTDSFTYDNVGNRKTWNRSGESVTYSYDRNNRLTTATSTKSGSIVYTYDRNGNQLTSSDGTTYTYDGFNQLASVTLPDGKWMENQYDAFGLRVSVYENGMRSEFTYDRGSIITEVAGSDKLVSRSIRGLGLVARESSAGTIAYYLNNAHGNTSKIVNENGDILNTYEYDAFGNTANYSEKVKNRFLYAGEQFDKVSRQYYLRARYYDPELGRFVTEDTYRSDVNSTMSLNLYTYCGNNPVIFIDPSGHYYIIKNGEMFELKKDSYLMSGSKAVISWLPLGEVINAGIDKANNVVGGDSASDTGESAATDLILSTIIGNLGKAGEILDGVWQASESVDDIKGINRIALDNIAFQLMNDANISLQGKSINELDKRMANVRQFIANNTDYFFNKVDGKTLYEIDYNTSTTFEKNKLIDKYANSYTLYVMYNLDVGRTYAEDMYTVHYRKVLNQWKDRRNNIISELKNDINESTKCYITN